jgi:hypothetical protein
MRKMGTLQFVAPGVVEPLDYAPLFDCPQSVCVPVIL